MQTSKFIQVNKNALIEIIHDENNNHDFDYDIISDQKNNTLTFAINPNEPNVLNTTDRMLFLIDNETKKHGIVDFDKYSFLQKNSYSGNANSTYNTIKIWLPINYNFHDSIGFFLNIYSLDFDNNIKYNLSNFYLDVSDSILMNQIELSQKPFRMNNKLWGKSITLHIPSVYYESRQVQNHQPKVGSINNVLTNGRGFSTTAPIFFDFRFLFNRNIILNETIYKTTSSTTFSTPQAPNNIELSVSIESAQDGDYFIIKGLYNGTQGGLNEFMRMKDLNGDPSYLLYSITLYEDNLAQSTRDIYVYENYQLGIDDYRPVIKYTNTLASIKVDMKLVSMVDDSVDVKSAEYVLTGNEVAKYGKSLTPINITGSIKPKLYNSAPTQVTLPTKDVVESYFRRKAIKKVDVRYVPYPVMFDSASISIKGVNIENDDAIYKYDELMITLEPFDNVYIFSILDKSDESSYKEYEIPTKNTTINMIFKSNGQVVEIPLYTESNNVDLKRGIVAFNISETDVNNIKKIYQFSNNWYITLLNNGIETVLYKGKFKFDVKEIDTVLPTLDIKIKPLILKYKPQINQLKTTPLVEKKILQPGLQPNVQPLKLKINKFNL